MPTATRAARLHAVIAKVAPNAAAHYTESNGNWPKRPDNASTTKFERRIGDGSWLRDKTITDEEAAADSSNIRPARHGVAPYEIQTLPDGRRRVVVHGDEGDTFTGVGDTLEAALIALEKKVGLAPTEGK